MNETGNWHGAAKHCGPCAGESGGASFDSDDASPQRNFEAFAEAIDPIFHARLNAIEMPQFSVGVEMFNVGSILMAGRARMWGARFDYARDGFKIAHNGAEAVLVQIITKGGDVRVHDGEAQATRPGDICIADMTRPFATQAQGCENISLIVPHGTLGLDEARLDGLHGLILRHDTLGAQIMRAHAEMLVQGLSQASREDAAAAAQATSLMLGGLIAPMVRGHAASAGLTVAALYRVKRFIRANLASPRLTPDSVAKAMGMSRATLYRVFAPLGGVGDYIRHQRLQRVFADLGDPARRGESVAEIAYGWGFSDWSTFSRAFKSTFGITPSEARASGMAPRPDGGDEDGGTGTSTGTGAALSQWLRRLDRL